VAIQGILDRKSEGVKKRTSGYEKGKATEGLRSKVLAVSQKYMS
jgi:hypothetical protein